MSRLLRFYSPGYTYFVTAVSHNREPFLIEHADLLNESFRSSQTKCGSRLSAWVVLPDHLHLIVTPSDGDLSRLMHKFKLSFSRLIVNRGHLPCGPVWQKRFWDHIIPDNHDLRMHLDYIHYNPVKHNHVTDPALWEHSSFSAFRDRGLYPPGWGSLDTISFDGDFGE